MLCDAIAAMSWQTLAPMLTDMLASSPRAPVMAMGAARVGDPGATRTVYATIVLLVVLGLALAALAIWVFRRTRPEPELLAPLETMETRRWRKLDPAAQRRSLDQSRPAGAAPLRREASAPPVDRSFATVAPVASFDDLSDDGNDLSDDRDDDHDADNPGIPDISESADSFDSDLEDLGEDDREPTDAEQPEDDGEPARAEPEDRDATSEIPEAGEFDAGFNVDDRDDTPTGRSLDPLLLPPPSPGHSN